MLQVWLFNPDGSSQSYDQVPVKSLAAGQLLFDVNARIPSVRALDDQIQPRAFDFVHARCEVQSVARP